MLSMCVVVVVIVFGEVYSVVGLRLFCRVM